MTDSLCTGFAKKWKSTREKLLKISDRDMDERFRRTRDFANSRTSAQFSRLKPDHVSRVPARRLRLTCPWSRPTAGQNLEL